jgi:hypothetical protein
MGLFSRLQSFTDVQARRFARHPDCSYRSAFTLGSRGFYVRAYHGSLPLRAPDMLIVRFGQLLCAVGDDNQFRRVDYRGRLRVADGGPD